MAVNSKSQSLARRSGIRRAIVRNYFFGLSLLILMMSFVAFSDNLIFDTGQESNSQPRFIIHGLLMFAWFIIVTIQTNSIRKLNYKAHMRLGQLGFIVAVLMLLSIYYLHWVIGDPWITEPNFVKANRIFGLVGGGLIISGYVFRKKPLVHKFCIFSGILIMMLPIVDRVDSNTGVGDAGLYWLFLWFSIFAFDIISRRKIHPILYLTFVVNILTFVLVGIIYQET